MSPSVSAVLILVLAAAAAGEPSKSVTFSCEESYTLVGRDCYLVSSEVLMGSSAESFCALKGGHAAVIETQEELDMLKNGLLNTTVLLGVNMQDYRKYQFNAALKMAGHTGFTAFAAGEPNNYGSEDCIVADSTAAFAWRDIPCTERHPVLCKAAGIVSEEELSCGREEHLFGGATCFWVENSSVDYTWSAAQAQCRARGMELVSIHSQEENDFILDLTDGITTWLGLTDTAVEGIFEWTDGSALDFQNWYTGQPNGGNCVFMSGGSWEGEWADDECGDVKSRLACKAPAY